MSAPSPGKSRLVVVAGNSGVGKTTFTRILARLGGFSTGLERHAERPFHAALAHGERRAALPNQVDFLTLRAGQELALRRGSAPGLQDGGLDEDFYVFTRFFHQKGYLNRAEFDLCARLHATLRELLGPPDLILRLVAPLEVVAERYSRRGRPLEVTQRADLAALEALLDEWLSGAPGAPLLTVDVSAGDPSYLQVAPEVLRQVRATLALENASRDEP